MGTTEVWRAIPGHDGYEASSMGNIRSSTKVLRASRLVAGYLKVHLGRAGQDTVHALVASAFLGPRPRGMCVAHKNSVKSDNRIDNLQYTTFTGNNLHERRRGTPRAVCPLMAKEKAGLLHHIGKAMRGENHGMAKHSESEARRVHVFLASGRLRREIAEEMNVPYMWVSHVATGRRWPHVHPEFKG